MHNALKNCKSFTERKAENLANIAANDERLAAVIAKTGAEVRSARANHEAAKLKTSIDFETEERQIDEALSVDFFETMVPIMAAYGDAPRTMAGKIAEAFRLLNARCLTELGVALNTSAIGRCFAISGGFDAKQGDPEFWHCTYANSPGVFAGNVVRLILGNAPTVAIDSALRALEESVAMRAHTTTLEDLEYSRAVRSRVSEQGFHVVRLALREARDDQMRAKNLAMNQAYIAENRRLAEARAHDDD